MQRANSPTPGSACKSDPQQSLFKFFLYFHETTDEYRSKGGKPWVWYSFDKPEERAMFPDGLPRDLRTIFGDLLYKSYRWPDLYAFLRDCHPVWQTGTDGSSLLNLYMSEKAGAQLQEIAAKYEETITYLMQQVNVPLWRINYKANTRTVPGFSPMRKRTTDYYGIKCFKKNAAVSAWFSTRKLKMVKVFDNRCYHVDNHFTDIGPEEYPMPLTGTIPPITPTLAAPALSNLPPQPTWPQIPPVTTSTAGRINKPVSVGSILSHFPK
ncbi:hypothetical protein [Spirosoma oryzicola]|uniref:hypothetical protein n=1 Tax=Spirosoma oryzicola TaxID=2898794 RepID=UPI001E506476|nr:hypothetical protein [Spirosoma oryzicola]UHG90088.1 hypothetical protein LQ777_17770 [Spirosoma oryzicola]